MQSGGSILENTQTEDSVDRNKWNTRDINKTGSGCYWILQARQGLVQFLFVIFETSCCIFWSLKT